MMKEFSKKEHSKDKFVNSLDEYIKQLSLYPSNNFFFRGENGLFDEREAGAFREHNGGWKADYQDFMDMVNDYYCKISYRLDETEKLHFLAFSQHYGIPTNLIDVSESPLTALYFACNGDFNEGYVYVFDNEFIDVTSIITKKPKKNFVELMLEKDQYAISEFLEQIKIFQQRFPKRFQALFDCLVSDLKHYIGKPLSGIDITKLKTFQRKRCDDLTWQTINASIAFEINKDEQYIDCSEGIFSLASIYTVLAIYLLTKLHDYEEYLYWLNWLPVMIYKPNILFERARIQHGFFIAQAFIHHIEPVYEVDVLARQRIFFNNRIKISNTCDVLTQLDNIGTNRATIFGDFDNIAQQIVKKSKVVTP